MRWPHFTSNLWMATWCASTKTRPTPARVAHRPRTTGRPFNTNLAVEPRQVATDAISETSGGPRRAVTLATTTATRATPTVETLAMPTDRTLDRPTTLVTATRAVARRPPAVAHPWMTTTVAAAVPRLPRPVAPRCRTSPLLWRPAAARRATTADTAADTTRRRTDRDTDRDRDPETEMHATERDRRREVRRKDCLRRRLLLWRTPTRAAEDPDRALLPRRAAITTPMERSRRRCPHTETSEDDKSRRTETGDGTPRRVNSSHGRLPRRDAPAVTILCILSEPDELIYSNSKTASFRVLEFQSRQALIMTRRT